MRPCREAWRRRRRVPSRKEEKTAYLVNTLTGESKRLEAESDSLLTSREKLILQMIQQGKSSKTIGERLGISKHTVDRHRQNIITKLQVTNTAEACHKALVLGLID